MLQKTMSKFLSLPSVNSLLFIVVLQLGIMIGLTIYANHLSKVSTSQFINIELMKIRIDELIENQTKHNTNPSDDGSVSI